MNHLRNGTLFNFEWKQKGTHMQTMITLKRYENRAYHMAVMIRLKQFHRDNTKEHNSQAIAGLGTQTMFTKATVKQAVFPRIVQKNGDLRPSLHACQHLHSNISLHTMSMPMSPSYANTYSRSLETKIVQKPLWSSLQGYKMFHTCSTQKARFYNIQLALDGYCLGHDHHHHNHYYQSLAPTM